MKIINFLKDIIAPKKCYSCNKEWCFLCKDCLHLQKRYCITQVEHNFTNKSFDEHLIVFRYKWNLIQDMIKDWKYYKRKDVFEDLWLILWQEFEKKFVNLDKRDKIVLFSPMHFFKKILRWFNQAEIISKSFAKYTWYYLGKDIIKKHKHTVSQTKLSWKLREKNMDNIFSITDKKTVFWKTVILIDDVITTWSTLNSISKELKKCWASYIIVLALASQ